MDLFSITLFGGLALVALGPTFIVMLSGGEISQNQMILYTVGWLLSLCPTIWWLIGTLFSFDSFGNAGKANDRFLLSMACVHVLYFPMLVIALVGGWVAFSGDSKSVAWGFMLLPLTIILLYLTLMLMWETFIV